MRLLKRSMRTLAILTALVVFGSLAGYTEVSAAEYDSSRKGSITIELHDIGTEKENVKFRLYKVSELDAEEELASADKSSAQEMKTLAEALKKKAEQINASYEEKTVGKDGTVKFSDLSQDVYLICQSDTAKYGTVAPFVAEIPFMENGKDWIYDIVTAPKGEALEPENPPKEPENPDNPSDNPDKPSGKPQKNPDKVKTGDESNFVWYGVVMIAALGISLWSIAGKRNRKN